MATKRTSLFPLDTVALADRTRGKEIRPAGWVPAAGLPKKGGGRISGLWRKNPFRDRKETSLSEGKLEVLVSPHHPIDRETAPVKKDKGITPLDFLYLGDDLTHILPPDGPQVSPGKGKGDGLAIILDIPVGKLEHQTEGEQAETPKEQQPGHLNGQVLQWDGPLDQQEIEGE